MQILLGALSLLAGGRKSLGAKFCSKCLCAAAEQGGKRADGPALSAAASDGLFGLVCAAEWLRDGRWRSGVLGCVCGGRSLSPEGSELCMRICVIFISG